MDWKLKYKEFDSIQCEIELLKENSEIVFDIDEEIDVKLCKIIKILDSFVRDFKASSIVGEINQILTLNRILI